MKGCTSEVVSLPRHLVACHGWSQESAQSATRLFGLRKPHMWKKPRQAPRNKDYHHPKQCPVGCGRVVKRLAAHLHDVHGIKDKATRMKILAGARKTGGAMDVGSMLDDIVRGSAAHKGSQRDEAMASDRQDVLLPYVCDFCQCGFAYRAQIMAHRRMHTAEKPHTCDVCLRRFSDHNSSERHLRTQTSELSTNVAVARHGIVSTSDSGEVVHELTSVIGVGGSGSSGLHSRAQRKPAGSRRVRQGAVVTVHEPASAAAGVVVKKRSVTDEVVVQRRTRRTTSVAYRHRGSGAVVKKQSTMDLKDVM